MTLFSFVVILSACNKKFKHEDYTSMSNPQNCSMCEYADSIEGTFHIAYNYLNYYQVDTGTLKIEHVFLDLGPKIDSTKMFFKLTGPYLTGKIVSLDSPNGIFYNSGYGKKMYLDGDSIFYEDGYSHKYGFTKNLFFKGSRVP